MALDLNKKLGRGHEVTVIDKSNCHLFLPSLYEVASARSVEKDDVYGIILRETICVSYEKIFSGKNISFIQAEASHINIRNQEVHLGSGKVINYDYLVLALGSEVETFGIPGVREYAHQFKSMEDALLIHKKMHEYFQEAKEGKRELPVRFLVGGAGFTGIELAAELACCAEDIRRACNLKSECTDISVTDISVFEAAPQILPMVSDKERKIIRRRLERLGVKIYENSSISEIKPEGVKIKDGKFVKGDIIIWTAGIRASSFASNIAGLHTDQRGRIKVNEFLQAIDYANIFAVGDSAAFFDPRTQKTVPGLAYVAIDEGRIAAENIVKK